MDAEGPVGVREHTQLRAAYDGGDGELAALIVVLSRLLVRRNGASK
jgi:hypothetical protein